MYILVTVFCLFTRSFLAPHYSLLHHRVLTKKTRHPRFFHCFDASSTCTIRGSGGRWVSEKGASRLFFPLLPLTIGESVTSNGRIFSLAPASMGQTPFHGPIPTVPASATVPNSDNTIFYLGFNISIHRPLFILIPHY